MADPPPKKIGSLRDRIAAFENKGPAPAPTPPTPRPKPAGGVSWKPRPASPPPPAPESDESAEKKAGMSAADAKASIAAGGSLRERMAALQGRGGFSGAAPPTSPPPRPSSEKPKWKPPPPVASPSADEGDSREDAPKVDTPADQEPKSAEQDEEPSEGQAAEEKQAPDEEEEERQRRAAIAARMARLGGARVGMGGPPVFAKKPEYKKPATPKVEEPKAEEAKEEAQVTETDVPTSDLQNPADDAPVPANEGFQDKDASSTSLLSPESGGATPSAPRSPSMPVPAVPRRAAPPRRKTPKSPSPTPASVPIHVTDAEVSESPVVGTPQETSDDKSKELQDDVHRSKEDEEPLNTHQADIAIEKAKALDADEETPESNIKEASEEGGEISPVQVEPVQPVQQTEEHDVDHSTIEAPKPGSDEEQTEEETTEAEASIMAEEIPAEPQEEEDEEARRQRIAERLRQQGGFNPFAAPPPIRKSSVQEVDSEIKPEGDDIVVQKISEESEPAPVSPPPPRRQSTRRESADSVVISPSASLARRASVQSVQSVKSSESTPISPPPISPATRPSAPERKSSQASAHNIEDEQDVSDRRRSLLSENIYEEPEGDADAPEDDDFAPEPATEPAYAAAQDAEDREHYDHSIYHELERESAIDGDDDPQNQLSPSEPVQHHTTHITDISSFKARSPPARRISLPPPRAIPPVPTPGIVSSPSSRRPIPPTPFDAAHSPVELPSRLPLNYPTSPAERSADTSIPRPPVAKEISPRSRDGPDVNFASQPPPPPTATHRLSADLHSPKRSLPPLPPVLPPTTEDEPGADHDDEPEHVPTDPSDYSEGDVEGAVTDHDDDEQSATALYHAEDSNEFHKEAEHEVLDDSDVDPIDPAFYSPQKTTSSTPFSHLTASDEATAVAAQDSQAEDEATTKRRTIASRMAKLGGIQFGAAPSVGAPRRSPLSPRDERDGVELAKESGPEREISEAVTEEPEEDEAARRQRIAARLAGMGGMRFGMLPGLAPVAPAAPPTVKLVKDEVEAEKVPQPPSRRSSSIPSPEQQRQDESEAESEGQSVSDVVQVEAEESELEEVTYHDVEEEAPPPVPSRQGRRSSLQQPARSGSTPRPPVPTGRPPIPPPTTRPSLPPTISHGDFVLVEQADAAGAPPELPPPRKASLKKGHPSRSVPLPPPPPTGDLSQSSNSQWETSVDFGGDTDLSLSGKWSEDSTHYPSGSTDTQSTPVPQSAAPSVVPTQMSADELMAQWGRVGVQIHEIATTLYEKSRKSIVGDRTYLGFVNAVLSHVPNASKPIPPYDSFGYLIYEQSGSSVVRHSSDIMPGDIVVMRDAKLKGHKGLQMYQQTVGANEPVFAVVGDFEVKKMKVKAFQASHHVGQESVESVSYRLEDMKSGSAKIYRVLEA